MDELFVIDEGTGPSVLLIHGLAGVSKDWTPVVRRLTPDHRVLIPDRPGYGRSGRKASSMVQNAERLAEMLCARQSGRTVVVGHSYGAGVAVLLAAHHPTLVSGLVLVAPVGRANGDYSRARHVFAWPVIGEVISAGKLFALQWLQPRLQQFARRVRHSSQPGAEPSNDSFMGNVPAWVAGTWRTVAAEQRSLLREIASVEASLSGLRLPVVVVAGALDDVVPPSVAENTAAAVDGAELTIVADTGHVLPRDAPNAVASAMRDVEQRIELRKIAGTDGAGA